MNTATIDIKEMLAYSRYLIMLGQIRGNLTFDGHKSSPKEQRTEEMCRYLCGKIADEMAECEPYEIAELLECYDILHRMGYRKTPDTSLIHRCRRRMYNAWKDGDKSVEESQVFAMALSSSEKELKDTLKSLRDKWVKTLTKYDHFPDATAHENYRRLALVMREKLDGHFGKNANEMKHRWASHNIVADFSPLSTRLLQSYRRFAASLYPIVVNDFNEMIKLDCKIISELSTRTNVVPYDREALHMALTYNRILLEDLQRPHHY